MRMQYFGDSYDIVKKFLIHSLAPDAEWMAFPMFSQEFNSDQIQAFEEFLNVKVINRSVFTNETNRIGYLSASDHYRNIFLDPDKGISIKTTKSAKHISASELVALCRESPNRLLLVFDQSLDRQRKREEEIEEKLLYFQKHNINGFTYKSHACFVILSVSKSVCQNAYDCLLNSGLPSSMFVLKMSKI